ncbi:hypothetical protein AB0C12_37425 [Actinoplanes sp. NPDC048967]|uniref:hypothetical protein n=1 Tax=Actinoplanes sp. NPDC048967 TaxID=3155269 RepID=UPI0033D4F87D
MAYVKYTREMLSEAVTASTSMAGVLRQLGLPQNGGAHAHLRRRIDKFGVDTSHFLGQGHYRGVSNPKRQGPDEVLILRAPGQNREKPARLRRALIEMGRPYLCAACGVSDHYNGSPLVLHVDHVDGQLWDCRPHNVRFLCPNCHSQTPTFAGRKSGQNPRALVSVDDQGNITEDQPPRDPLSEDEVLELLSLVARNEISGGQAARLIGCTRGTVYRMQRRLAERGSITSQRRPPIPSTDRQAIIRTALAQPSWGPRQIAAELSNRRPDPISVTVGVIGNVLTRAGLSNREARAAAARDGEQHPTV